jgi:hypothetical protein
VDIYTHDDGRADLVPQWINKNEGKSGQKNPNYYRKITIRAEKYPK